MLYVALAQTIVFLAALAVIGGLLRSQQRSHARREDLLVNQLLHAAGRTWQPPPAPANGKRGDDGELVVGRWTPTPEQFPAD